MRQGQQSSQAQLAKTGLLVGRGPPSFPGLLVKLEPWLVFAVLRMPAETPLDEERSRR
jgi:hypothetical protein